MEKLPPNAGSHFVLTPYPEQDVPACKVCGRPIQHRAIPDRVPQGDLCTYGCARLSCADLHKMYGDCVICGGPGSNRDYAHPDGNLALYSIRKDIKCFSCRLHRRTEERG